MELRLVRMPSTKTYTAGDLYINDKWFCHTLEDPVREVKIPKETAIPFGRYKVIINFSNRFQRLMPLLLNVPNFEGIRIHGGNTAKDTEGCPLVGLARNPTDMSWIGDSRRAFGLLMAKLTEAVNDKEDIFITVTHASNHQSDR